MNPTVHLNALHPLTQRLPIARLMLFLPRKTFFPQVRVSSILFCHPTFSYAPSSAIQPFSLGLPVLRFLSGFHSRVLHCSQFPGIHFTCPNDRNPFPSVTSSTTSVGTLIVATIYLQLIQNRYMFVASDMEVVGYL